MDRKLHPSGLFCLWGPGLTTPKTTWLGHKGLFSLLSAQVSHLLREQEKNIAFRERLTLLPCSAIHLANPYLLSSHCVTSWGHSNLIQPSSSQHGKHHEGKHQLPCSPLHPSPGPCRCSVSRYRMIHEWMNVYLSGSILGGCVVLKRRHWVSRISWCPVPSRAVTTLMEIVPLPTTWDAFRGSQH